MINSDTILGDRGRAAGHFEIENEWRVEPTREAWEHVYEKITALPAERVQQSRVCDIVFGRHGFDSIQRDGFVVRLRGPSPLRLELKERLDEGVWKEISLGIDSLESAFAILRKLDLYPHMILDRFRISTSSPRYSICLDDILGLGRFVEVETRDGQSFGDDLEDLVSYVSAFDRLPPYGDIVRGRLSDPIFENEFKELIRSSEFGFVFA